MPVTPPPLLLGAALLFWGWQTGFPFLALPLAILIEAARALTWRLELSATDFHRLTDLCTLLIGVSGVYLFSTTGTSRAVDGPRATPLWWAPMLGVAALAGYSGHVALHRFQQVVEQTVFDYIFSMVRGDADPFRVTTAIGHLGRLKLSERTVLRVEPREGLRLPFLLREASYDVYNSPAWLASGAAFTAVQPEADGETWRFGAGRSPVERITVSAYLNRGRGVLALPGGAFEIDRLAVVGVQKNRLGAVKVEEGLGLVTYTTLFTPDGPLDAPPVEADLQVPTREAPLVSRIAADLGLAGGSPVEKVDIIAAYFRRNFRYSTWKGERPRRESALEEFLLNSRAGHCEYF